MVGEVAPVARSLLLVGDRAPAGERAPLGGFVELDDRDELGDIVELIWPFAILLIGRGTPMSSSSLESEESDTLVPGFVSSSEVSEESGWVELGKLSLSSFLRLAKPRPPSVVLLSVVDVLRLNVVVSCASCDRYELSTRSVRFTRGFFLPYDGSPVFHRM